MNNKQLSEQLREIGTQLFDKTYDPDYKLLLDEASDRLENQNEWISVEERLPKHEERCLIFTKIHFVPDHVDECDYYEGVEISTFYQDRFFLSNNGMYATHWMSLPEAPKMKGGAE